MKHSDTITSKDGYSLHPDAELVQLCLRGNRAGEKLLYEQYKQQMFRLCLRYAGSRQEAEDFLQDGFVRVFKDLSQYRKKGPLGAWIRKVMLNTIFQHFRKRKIAIASVEIQTLETELTSDDDLPGNLDAEIITRYIQALPEGYRTVFNMFAIEGFTHQEIAQALGINVGTSKSQLSKARAMLKLRLAAIHSPEGI